MADAATSEQTTIIAPSNVIIKGQRKIHPSRFKVADGARNVWVIVPEEGTRFEDILDPSYWAHISGKLRPTDRIEVYAEDGAYFAELIVRTSGRLTAQVALLRKVDLDPADQASPAVGHEVRWRGPHHKHAVVRMKDNQPIQTGFETKESALQWLSLNARTLAG